MDHRLFNKWRKFDGNVHCDSVVAYLENDNFGYIVKEHFENGKLFHFCLSSHQHYFLRNSHSDRKDLGPSEDHCTATNKVSQI